MAGYDRLSRHVSRISVYPLHLLPNTEYTEKRSEYGIVSVRGDHDDFEYILAHNTMSFADNELMKRFLSWTRVMTEGLILRGTWVGLRELGGVTQSQVLKNLDAWIAETDDPAAGPLQDWLVAEQERGKVACGDAVKYLFGHPDAKRLLERWWDESLRPLLPPENAEALDDVFRYDLLTQPYYRHPDAGPDTEVLDTEKIGTEVYVKRSVTLRRNVPALLAALRQGDAEDHLRPADHPLDLYFRLGAETYIGNTNLEQLVYFVGSTREAIETAAIAASAESEDVIGGTEGIALRLTENAGYAQ